MNKDDFFIKDQDITIKSKLLNTLKVGQHTIQFFFTDGTATADFSIKDANTPDTDNSSNIPPNDASKPSPPVTNTETPVPDNEKQLDNTSEESITKKQTSENQTNKMKSAKGSSNKKKRSPMSSNTGDTTHLALTWLAFLIAFLICLLMIIKIRKKA